VEPGRPEVVSRADREILVFTEHDAKHDATAEATGASAHSSLDAIAKPVAEPQDASPATGLSPARRPEDDVDPLAREPGTLVEAVLLRTRLLDPDVRLEDRAPRRRAPDRQGHEDAFSYGAASERSCLREHAGRERGRARRRDRDQLGFTGLSDVRDEDAP